MSEFVQSLRQGRAAKPSKALRVLLQEHFRRMALWGEALNANDYWPFQDFSEMLGEIDNEKLVTLRSEAAKLPFLPPEKKVVDSILKWKSLKEIPMQGDLPDPFEPLIKFFQRGGRFLHHNRYIEFENLGALPIGSQAFYLKAQPFTNCSEKELEQLEKLPMVS